MPVCVGYEVHELVIHNASVSHVSSWQFIKLGRHALISTRCHRLLLLLKSLTIVLLLLLKSLTIVLLFLGLCLKLEIVCNPIKMALGGEVRGFG